MSKLKRIITAIAFAIISIWYQPDWINAAETITKRPPYHGLDDEIPIIGAAAERNNCNGKLFSILLAIRKAEGTPTFGIDHPACRDMVEKDPNNAADIYASFAARTVRNNFRRFEETQYPVISYQDWIEFINYLGNVYCPVRQADGTDDPQGNISWKKNVKYWFRKFEATE
ncbi:MAG: hypothetical protein PHY02_09650 [Phycisphaerae bacterium]|nr:hypothetical protein [Phycisphaerae bacterium]